MGQDGASLGIMPERALGTIFRGDDQPTEDEKLSPEEFETKIRVAPIESRSYDGASLAMARIIVDAVEKYPCLRGVPMESVYLRDKDEKMVWFEDRESPSVHIRAGMYDVLKDIFPDEACPERKVMQGLSGFMWGWAYNAAAQVLKLEAQPNPAIMEITIPDSTDN